MNEHDTGSPATPGPDSMEPEPIESREQLIGQVRAAVERASRGHARAAVVVVQIDPTYARRAFTRVHEVLADARRQRSERVHLASLGANRFALVAAPIGYPGQAKSLAEQLTRSLDPRICPLLHRALPYAWSGVSLFPDQGMEAEVLIAHAEQALELARNSGARRRPIAFARRRDGAAGVLRPISVR
jgi:GGDEF domain-containing protein